MRLIHLTVVIDGSAESMWTLAQQLGLTAGLETEAVAGQPSDHPGKRHSVRIDLRPDTESEVITTLADVITKWKTEHAKETTWLSATWDLEYGQPKQTHAITTGDVGEIWRAIHS